MLMNPAEKNTPKASGELVITVIANFTVEPIGDILRFWVERLGLGPSRLEFSGYNQVFQELIAPNSLLASSELGVNFLLIRFEDWGRDQKESLRTGTITAAVREFIGIFNAFAQRSRRPTILLLCPPSRIVSADLELARVLQSLEEDVRSAAAGLHGVSVIAADDVAALYPVKVVDDPESDRQGHIPFTRDYWVAMGTILARKARTVLQAPRKVIAVDADNTLWGGVVAEAEVNQVQVTGEWRRVQEFLQSRKQEGMLLVLVSKNKEEDVAAVFRRSDMILRREDFVAWKVNWAPKSENVRALASELELGLDSFIFLDDNPMECAEVAAYCPPVTVVTLPAQAENASSFLGHVWVFDLPPATSADKGRTEQYRQQAERKQFQASVSSFRKFIEKLELKVELAALKPEQFERAAQLTQRTNQFNATGTRRTAAELASLLASGERQALLVRVRDRFGEYGEVGLCVYSPQASELHVENFLLSCRVLGKGVEHRMLAALGQVADEFGKGYVAIPFRRTERNEPAEKFLESVGSAFRQGDLYRFPAAVAKAIVFDPGNVKEALPVADGASAAKASSAAPACDFGEIAGKLATVSDIHLAIRQKYLSNRPALKIEYVPPRNASEQALAEIWANVLNLDRVGIHDNFFDLGGDSVLSIQIISRAGQFGLRFTLRQQFQYPTIAELASVIKTANVAAANAEQGVVTSTASSGFPLAKLRRESLEKVMAHMSKIGK